MFDGYFLAVEEANHSFSFESDYARKANVLLLAETMSTLLSIISLIYYVYEISSLCFQPCHFPAYMSYFLTSHSMNATLLFFFHLYL